MADDSGRTGVLTGKVAAVTGASSGSGRAIAKLFAAEGAQVVLLARGAERLAELQDQLGPTSLGIPTDIGDPDSVRTAFATIEQRYGKLDVLINNAALYRSSPLELFTDEEILAQVRTNLLGPIYTCRAAIPLLRAAGGGEIVNTSSEATIEFHPLYTIYTATKAGVEALSQSLRTELEKEEIRVTTLIQGVAIGEGGGSAGWTPSSGFVADAGIRLQSEAVQWRTMGAHGSQQVAHVAEVHLFVVTRPRGQKLDVLRVRSY